MTSETSPGQPMKPKKRKAPAAAKPSPAAKPPTQSKKLSEPKGDRAAAPKGPMAWPAAQIEMVPIKDLVPYAKNARTHSQAQVLGIARSMEEFGWTNPVLRDEENTIIAGHGRLLAAPILVERGRTEFSQAPVMTARGWTKAQKQAYAIADNQIALNAGWDPKLLESELKELSGMGFDMNLLGFSPAELRNRIGVDGGGLTDPNATPNVALKPVTRRGDLWLLGKHRVLCGDATDKADVTKLLGDARVPLLVSDPPYGVDYDPDWRNRVKRQDGSRVGAKAVGVVTNDDRADWREAWALFPGNVAYVWHGGKLAACVQQSLEAVGFEVRSQIVWAKQQFVIGRGDYHWQHECCLYVVRRSHKSNWKGGRKQSTVWQINAPSGWAQNKTGPDAHTGIHSTQKMVECMRRPIENNTDAGETVYDPFLGSGTTIIAAEQIARLCFGLELNPLYVDVAVRRWQNFTGKKALLSGRDISFEEVESERRHGGKRTKANADKAPRNHRKPAAPAAKPKRAEAAGDAAAT